MEEEKSKLNSFLSSIFAPKWFETVSKLILLLIVVIIPPILIRHYTVVLKPGTLIFTVIMWLVSLYFLFEKALARYMTSSGRRGEKRKLVFHGLVVVAIMLCGIFIMITSPENRGIGALAVAFFGVCLISQIRRYLNE